MMIDTQARHLSGGQATKGRGASFAHHGHWSRNTRHIKPLCGNCYCAATSSHEHHRIGEFGPANRHVSWSLTVMSSSRRRCVSYHRQPAPGSMWQSLVKSHAACCASAAATHWLPPLIWSGCELTQMETSPVRSGPAGFVAHNLAALLSAHLMFHPAHQAVPT